MILKLNIIYFKWIKENFEEDTKYKISESDKNVLFPFNNSFAPQNVFYYSEILLNQTKNMNEIEHSFIDLNDEKGTNAQINEKDLNKNLIDQKDLLSNNEDKLNKNSSNKSSSINQKAEAKKRKVIRKKRNQI